MVAHFQHIRRVLMLDLLLHGISSEGVGSEVRELIQQRTL